MEGSIIPDSSDFSPIFLLNFGPLTRSLWHDPFNILFCHLTATGIQRWWWVQAFSHSLRPFVLRTVSELRNCCWKVASNYTMSQRSAKWRQKQFREAFFPSDKNRLQNNANNKNILLFCFSSLRKTSQTKEAKLKMCHFMFATMGCKSIGRHSLHAGSRE